MKSKEIELSTTDATQTIRLKITEIKEIMENNSSFDNRGTIEVLLDGILDGIKQEPLATMIQQQYLN